MERWDVYDAQRRPLGRTHLRGVPMKKGEYHLVVFVWVFNRQGQVLMTKRSPEKRSYPNLWEHTGGAAQAGESSLQAIVRELREETGICAQPEEFRLVQSYRRASNNDICDIYFLHRDVEPRELTLQPGETCDAQWVSRAQLEELIRLGQVAGPDVRRYSQLQEALREVLK